MRWDLNLIVGETNVFCAEARTGREILAHKVLRLKGMKSRSKRAGGWLVGSLR